MLVQGGGELGFLLQHHVCCIMDAGSRTKEESRFEKLLEKMDSTVPKIKRLKR